MSVDRMEDTCSPGRNKRLQTYRIYSIVLPITFALLALESVFILSNIPGNLGSSTTVKGALPALHLNSKKL